MEEKLASGNVAVVTGAADGIGRGLSRAFAAAGMNVVMSDIDAERLDAAAQSLEAAEVLAVPADVSRPDQVQALADAAFERFGAVHVLCNNAGVTIPGRRVWNVPREDFEWMLRVNFWGVVHGVQAFVPRMLKQGAGGHVVNTASVGGLVGFSSIAAYSATKFAVVGLSEGLLHDLRERQADVGVSVLCPGATDTSLAQHSAQLRDRPQDAFEHPPGVTQATPDEVAAEVLAGIRANRFWIVTSHGYDQLLEDRQRAILGHEWEPVAPAFYA